jgi:hypothetical protein
MTRDSPSNTKYADKVTGTVKSVFKGLPPAIEYVSLFKKYCEYISNHRSAIYHATGLLPILATILVIQVERDLHHASELTEMRNQYNSELTKLREEMDQLRRDIHRLTSHD